MALRPPRRIFRGTLPVRSPSSGVFRALLVGLLGVGVGAGAILLSAPSNLFGRVPAPSGVLSAEAGAVSVVDGDTLLLRETVVRLRGVLAPGRGTSCQGVRGEILDCGGEAARGLAAIVRGRDLACRLVGRDERGFVQADCLAGPTDVNRAIVAAGWARVSPEDSAAAARLRQDEQSARTARLGLWLDMAAKPL